jgi:hypothetical protein
MIKKIFALSFISCLALAYGCGGGAVFGGPPPAADWGGFEPTDEKSSFAKDSSGVNHAVTAEVGQPLDDSEIEGSAEYAALVADSSRVVYTLRIEWGAFFTNIKPTSGLHADGSLVTTRGIIITDSGVRLENSSDFIIRPRTSGKEATWNSNTSSSSDGLIFKIITLPDTYYNETRVTLNMPEIPYNRTFVLSELRGLNVTLAVGDNGNLLSITGFKVREPEVSDGYMVGRWETGKIIGRWTDPSSAFTGKFEGYYQTQSFYTRVFYCKLTDMNGKFKGMIRGTWCAPDYTGGVEGWFAGVYSDEYLAPVGIVGGHFVEGAQVGDGFFRGVWHAGFPSGWLPQVMPSAESTGGTIPSP